MKVNNPLTDQFLRLHPADAARTMERFSPVDIGIFFSEIESEIAFKVYKYMLPEIAISVLEYLSDTFMEKISEQNSGYVARLLRNLDKDRRERLLQKLPAKTQTAIQRQMIYPDLSVGAVAKGNCPVFPARLTVGEVLKRLEKRKGAGDCLIYVVDDEQKYIGTIEAGRILVIDRHTVIGTQANKRTPYIYANLHIEDIAHHQAWRTYRQLPVITKGGAYLGYIDYETLQNLLEENQIEMKPTDPFGGLLSLIGMYWLSVAWVFELFFTGKKKNTNKSKSQS